MMKTITSEEEKKLKQIINEEWLLPIWIKKLEEFDKVFSMMVEKFKSFDHRLKKIEDEIDELKRNQI